MVRGILGYCSDCRSSHHITSVQITVSLPRKADAVCECS
jgi:hypothetical protein